MEMDESVGKRVVKGFRRGAGIVFRDNNPEDSKSQNCSRAGCISRVCSSVGSCSEIPEKPNHVKASFHAISGKAITGSSSKPFLVSSTRRFFQKQPNQAHLQEITVAESSHRQKIDDINNNNEEVLVDNLYSNGVKEVTESEPKVSKSLQCAVLKGLSTDIHEPSSNCSIMSSSKVHKQISRRLVSGNQEASTSSFGPRTTFASRKIAQTNKSFSHCLNTGVPRCGLKGLSSTSSTDVFPSDCPSSVSSSSRRVDVMGKKPSKGESSAANRRISTTETSVPSISVPRIMSDPVSRSTRNRITTCDRAFSVRTRRTSQASVEESGCTYIPRESVATHVQQSRASVSDLLQENSGAFSIDFPDGFSNASGQPSSRSHATQSREASHSEGGTHITHVSLGNQLGYRHFSLEGVAEILLALEQIEQERDLTYEQLLVLQSNLLLGAIRFHDRHRDMRMNIDNMSYEELLALEEKMGNVSTALNEDQLSKCLKKSIYPNAYLVPGTSVHGSDNDDAKCCICQEEYIIGDEVGRLWCEHQYHVACIQHWLRQKNWCPICKSSASPSQD
ncbi:uncharacterized protein LOC122026393 [Zingiber officinale]|uniref:uncharacterized protein LOC122026393 n=1 Tax=Zingiber officinale TaxID=94328 RepID=UPI001C4B4C03|nr:uncharacterized protein LOC122026393 [Zingiber officinale]XP_042441040.1 uncharacterized protein LOC122026393 [Zingiber officinale]XP_042441041.1 uncharacterized protein LOC122026393 [Zingiber officinale]XP_042441042.1 uncharacterized protein LOC122026393 [Zingiber officinale]XP_042441043.1 uncharacterized protein LOC122026393 [Zingiber officinale]